MCVSLDEFWDLAEASQLFDPIVCESLRKDFLIHQGNDGDCSARAAAQWLLDQRRISAFQARWLLNGKPGPFVFGEYLIVQPRPVPSRSMSRYDALHVSTRHRVLLWTVSDASMFGDRGVERGRRVRHANLAQWYESVDLPSGRIVVTESPAGQSLRTLLQQRHRLGPSQACHVIHQVAHGLSQLHARDIPHGCVRPEEIYVQASGHVRLVWSPIPIAYPNPTELPRDGTGWAVEYLAPEFLQPSTKPDSLTDVYALGCTLYELLEGCPPFRGATAAQVLAAHAGERLTLADVSWPDGLFDVVSFLLAKQRGLRYQSTDEVIEKLERYLPSGIQISKPQLRTTESLYRSHLEADRTRPAVVPEHLVSADDSPAVSASRPSTAHSPSPVTAAQPPPEISVRRSPALSAERRSRFGIGGTAWSFGIVSAVLIVILSTILAMRHRHAAQHDPTDPPQTPPVVSGPRQTETTPPPSDNLIDDDGRTLWVADMTGLPIELTLSPPGSQLFLYCRPRQLLAHVDGQRAFRALGPRVAEAAAQFQTDVGIDLAQIESLLIAYASQDSDAPVATVVVQLNPAQRQTVELHATNMRPVNGGTLGRLGQYDALFPTSSQRIVLGDTERIANVIEQPNARVRRQIEQLVQLSDRNRSMTILLAPNFLAADGRTVLGDPLSKLRGPLLDFIGDRTQAALLTADFSDLLYLELRWVTPIDEDPAAVAASRKRLMAEYPELIAQYLGEIHIDPFWQPLALRLPLMVDFLARQTRFGIDQGTAVMNAYLPAAAAHNLLLAGELALSQNRSPTDAPPPTLDLAQLLELPISIDIDQQSMEAAFHDVQQQIRRIAGVTDFTIRIDGPQLELAGVTRNQQIRDFHADGGTLRSVLTSLAVQANPTRVDSPADRRQQLVWIVQPSEAVILITTRQAAAEMARELPLEFKTVE